MTLPEKLLWRELRGSYLHVRRQAAMGRYVADFVIHDCKLLIEVDGPRHGLEEEQLHDLERDAWFATQGYRTLRFANARVLEGMDGVLAEIDTAVKQSWASSLPPPSPTLPPSRGKGE